MNSVVQPLNLSFGAPRRTRRQLAETKYYNVSAIFGLQSSTEGLECQTGMFDTNDAACIRRPGDHRKSPSDNRFQPIRCLGGTLTAYFDFKFSGSLALPVTS